MKTTILKSIFLVGLTTTLFTGCVKDENYDTPNLEGCTETTLVKNRDVSDILFSTTVSQHEDIVPGVSDVIEAYVVSSDIGGNFFKSISFQTLDKSIAFAVPVDATSTFINYEPGRKVLINLDGLYTDIKYDGKRIGGLYGNSSGGAEVGRLPLADFRQSVQRSCTVVKEDDLVQHVTIAEAMTGDTYLNKLIEFDQVQFELSATNSTYYDINNDLGGATNYTIMDIEGNTTIFRTSSYANFSAKAVASGSGKIRGIMTKYNSDYQFMVRSENDIMLTNPRFSPLLNEGFNSGIGDWSTFSVTGAQAWTYSSTYGNPGGMVKMSGYAGGNNANEDWLISPKQDLSSLTAANLTFDNAYKFTGPALKAYISNNYSGSGSPYAAGVTWTEFTGFTLSAGNYSWTNSGALNINAFTGTGNSNVYIAFKYTSTTAESSTWEVDNVKITPQ